MTQSTTGSGAVAAAHAQGGRRDRGRARGADVPADELGAAPPIRTSRSRSWSPTRPGGPSDISARMMAAEMQQVLGGSVFVENQGGAGGNIGYGYAARSEPDGYTILLTTSAYCVNPSLYHTHPLRSDQGFRGDLRAGGGHSCVRGQGRPAGQQHEGVRGAGEEKPGEVQRLDAADRHHAAASVRGAEAPRGHPGHGERGVQRRRRRGQGGARQHRANELGFAGAGAAADPGRHAQGAGADRDDALCRRCRMFRP